MYIIVGLGNPGKRYAGTRHNIGFDTIDYIAHQENIKVDKLKFKAYIGEGNIGGEKVVLIKPQTFMNLSGESVQAAIHFYKISLDRLIVIYDDIDIGTGTLRIRKKGSAGTHNGMRHIIQMLGEDSFPRVRIGIGHDDHMPLKNYVLTRYHKEEVTQMEEAVKRAHLAVDTLITENIDIAMSKYNG